MKALRETLTSPLTPLFPSRRVAEAGGRVAESRATRLAGELAALLRVTGPPATLTVSEGALECSFRICAGLHVCVRVAVTGPPTVSVPRGCLCLGCLRGGLGCE